MVVDPWIVWLILVPLATGMALYVGYLVLVLLVLLSLTLGLWCAVAATWLATICTRTGAWALRLSGPLVQPCKGHGPWLDYVVMAGLLMALALGIVLWLAWLAA
jgi:hypothetical protein